MSKRIKSFADLIAPVGEDVFFAEYHDQKPLHITANAPDKLDDVMSWDVLNALLNMTAIWSPQSLKLFLDTKPISTDQYCRQAIDRNNQQSRRQQGAQNFAPKTFGTFAFNKCWGGFRIDQ